MDEKIDLDLFARLMRCHEPARKDLLEYMGQGPVTMPPLRSLAQVRPEDAGDDAPPRQER